jgi:SulP family sulfate permease
MARSMPALALPPLTWEGVQQLVIPTLTIALLGAVESLTGARVGDQLTRLPRHDPDQELMAQGLANMVAPILGGLPVTGTIARTVTNVRAGATSPIAGIVHAVTLALAALAAAPLAAHVPLSVLAGLLLFVAWHMGEWHEFAPAQLSRFTLGHRVVLLGTFFLTVVFDLMVAVQVGLVTTCVFFIWRMSLLFRAQRISGTPRGVTLVRLHGALFFGAVGKIEALGERLPSGTRHLVLGLYRLIWIDGSGIDALVQLYRQLQREGIQLWLADLRDEPLAMAKRAGLIALVGADHVRTTSAECVEAAAQEVDAASA